MCKSERQLKKRLLYVSASNKISPPPFKLTLFAHFFLDLDYDNKNNPIYIRNIIIKPNREFLKSNHASTDALMMSVTPPGVTYYRIHLLVSSSSESAFEAAARLVGFMESHYLAILIFDDCQYVVLFGKRRCLCSYSLTQIW